MYPSLQLFLEHYFRMFSYRICKRQTVVILLTSQAKTAVNLKHSAELPIGRSVSAYTLLVTAFAPISDNPKSDI